MPSLTYSDIGSRMYFRPGFLLAMLVVPALSEPEPRTGSRLWTLADGRERPLRFLGTAERGTHVRFLSGRNQFTKPLSVLAESEQAAIKAFREGAWTLTSAPGLLIDPEFTLPRPAPWDWLSWYRVGTLRRWTNHNGKTLDARLLNLTDDHATLVIGERLWKQPVKDLSDADLAYLNEVKAGRALLLPGLVELTGGISWDGSRHYHSVHASGERLAAQPGPEGRFELVLAAALAHVKERFDGPVALRSLEEATTFYPKLDPPRAWLLAAPAEPFTGHTTLYRATFEAPSSRRQEVSALWPATTSPSTWPQLEWYVYFLPDAQPAPVHRSDD